MKNWRYFYLFFWLIIVSIAVNGWALNIGLLPKLAWDRLYEIYAPANIEDSTDLEYLATYVMSFSIVFLFTLPGFIAWNRMFPYREPTGWSALPIARAIRIVLVTIMCFIVLYFLYALFESVFVRYSQRIKFSVFYEYSSTISIGLIALTCGNLFRKMSR